jgi:hypothetical protein
MEVLCDTKKCSASEITKARVIQVGEVHPQWAILAFDSSLGQFIRTTDEGVNGMFAFHGYKTVDDAKRAAEDALRRHDPLLNVETVLWQRRNA